jgi:hypothetical protein
MEKREYKGNEVDRRCGKKREFFFCYYLFETAVHQLEFLAAESCVQPGKKKRESDIEF